MSLSDSERECKAAVTSNVILNGGKAGTRDLTLVSSIDAVERIT